VPNRIVKRLSILSKAIELRQGWESAVAFCSVGHNRLGHSSLMHEIPGEVLRRVIRFLFDAQSELIKYGNEDDEDEEGHFEEEEEEAAGLEQVESE